MLIGAIVRVSLDWSCDLNTDTCLPVYNFQRVDDKGNVTLIGYNYRDVQYFPAVNSTKDATRKVTKYYGVFLCFPFLSL